jgi:protein subunit release factor A
MNIEKKDLKIEYSRGRGHGGQRRDKVFTCVKMTHLPTGIVVTHDGRNREHNRQMALRELKNRIKEQEKKKRAKKKKKHRDFKIHNTPIIRTYDFKKQIVKDHRSGKTAPLKAVLEKGNLDLLR